jgi:NADH dehydrogenase [ubiquinone] 1 alpha subcomplex assembly factor 5
MAVITVFDRAQVRRQRDRAAATIADHGFLFDEVADRLLDRIDDVTRRFPVALDLGCHDGSLGRKLLGQGRIDRLISCDISPHMALAAGMPAVAGDEEALPFAPDSFDLVASNLSLHWVNDLPGALVQINRSLKPDGLLLASMLGGETLSELRRCMIEAESIEEGGVSPRISPFAQVRDAGSLLQRAGFALPVVDIDSITVTYADPIRLLADLRGMGETNATAARRRSFMRRSTLAKAMDLYRERFAAPDGRVTATFQVLTLTAWRPHESQQKPLARGSGKTSLAKTLAIGPKPPT